jgi:hypothetical protein
MLRDGISEDEVRARLAVELDTLKPEVRDRIEDYFDNSADIRTFGLHAAVSWASSSANGSWRYILTPSEAKTRYGRPHAWLASEELLATLGRRFAAAAVKALHLWEPDPDSVRPSPRDLRWLHAALLHLPHVTEEVKEKARAVVGHMRPRSRSPWERVDYETQQEDRRLDELRTAIERILGDPAAPSPGSALGDPHQVTVRDLARSRGTGTAVLRQFHVPVEAVLLRNPGTPLLPGGSPGPDHHRTPQAPGRRTQLEGGVDPSGAGAAGPHTRGDSSPAGVDGPDRR